MTATARGSSRRASGLALGITVLSVSLIVLVPLVALAAKAAGMGAGLLAVLRSPRVFSACRLSFGTAVAAALLNGLLGFLTAWVLVRVPFPGRRLVDALVDLPFALPTAVAGISLTTLYAETGWLGGPLARLGLKVAYTPAGIVVALVFVGLPFVVRTLQPVIASLDPEVEDAAACLGATRAQTFRRVVLPALLPAWFTGFALALARGLGEYGSVVFIAGNLPMRTEVAPLLVLSKLEQFDTEGATAIAMVLLAGSFALLLAINRMARAAREPGFA